jgi:hypothetical protein
MAPAGDHAAGHIEAVLAAGTTGRNVSTSFPCVGVVVRLVEHAPPDSAVDRRTSRCPVVVCLGALPAADRTARTHRRRAQLAEQDAEAEQASDRRLAGTLRVGRAMSPTSAARYLAVLLPARGTGQERPRTRPADQAALP